MVGVQVSCAWELKPGQKLRQAKAELIDEISLVTWAYDDISQKLWEELCHVSTGK